jgi:hypothetical protein
MLMRTVTVTNDGTIALTPENMQALNVRPGQNFVIARQGEEIVLTPLDVANSQD